MSAYGSAVADREILKISHREKIDDRSYRRRSKNEEIVDIQSASSIMESLEHCFKTLSSAFKPVLWHTDLHLGNIYVSDEDPANIVSIIDWQFIAIGPLLIQANWPEFLKPSDEYIIGIHKPALPDNFEKMDDVEKKAAIIARDEAIITKAYELRHYQYTRGVFNTLNLPPIFREIFVRCGEAEEEGTVALRACMAEFYRSWSTFGLATDCPVSFTEQELTEIEDNFKLYRDWHDVQEFAREYLDTDTDGWVHPDFDFKKIQKQNRSALQRYIREMSRYIPPQDARRRWPFLENV